MVNIIKEKLKSIEYNNIWNLIELSENRNRVD